MSTGRGTRIGRRKTLGKKFSEGARQTWRALETKDWTPADLARCLGIENYRAVRLLYGDRKPGLDLATKLWTDLGIEIPLWGKPPTKLFVPPGARKVPAPPPSWSQASPKTLAKAAPQKSLRPTG